MKDWGGYKAIIEEVKAEPKKPIIACPIDGTPLEFRNGVANCPMGNYRVTTRES